MKPAVPSLKNCCWNVARLLAYNWAKPAYASAQTANLDVIRSEWSMNAASIELKINEELEVPMTVAVLEERVNSHIKFVWTLMAVGFAWLAGISLTLYQMNGTMNRVEKAQADAPAKLVASFANYTRFAIRSSK